MLSYRIDAEAKIFSLKGDWDSFSRENGGQTGLEAAYIGRSLWDFVADFDTQSYLNALIFYVRQTQQAVSVAYRCDAPDLVRGFRMELVALPDASVRLDHHPLAIPAPSPSKITDFSAYRGKPAACSQCLMVEVNGTWIESFGLPRPDQFELRYTVCPSCRAAARGAMEQQQTIVKIGGAR